MINLLPSSVKVERSYGRKNTTLLKYLIVVLQVALLIAGTTLGGFIYGNAKLKQLNGEMAKLDTELGEVKSIEDDAKSVRDKLTALKVLFSSETNYVSLLEDIEAAVVPGSRLVALELNGNEKEALEMTFVVADEIKAAELKRSFEASERFKFVDIQSIRPTPQGVEVDYRLSFEPGKAR